MEKDKNNIKPINLVHVRIIKLNFIFTLTSCDNIDRMKNRLSNSESLWLLRGLSY